ncbi:DHH family phosphoesterase [Staphylococcus equorum]|uniref:DHH family phosphoesterase n=1 Tax=Staphylococcus equorum TaxID=246432 RepID=A0A9X4LCA5_9STAP|nr:DHH family phosphoesterase [Staphylococcus equorum]MDG0860374.1 DHH family phosphoesterase [Staphylococcus equorum]
MKIKQIGDYNGNIVETVLENRSINDYELLLNPTDEDNTSAFDLKNIDKAIEVFLAHIIAKSKIGLVVDADADGITSSSIMYQYIKEVNPESPITPFFHERKAHGLTEQIMNEISKTEIDLLIVPDAGSNDLRNIELLKAMEIDVLIIDHHEVEEETEFGVLINNQLSDNTKTNRNLVGAGMVLRFCEAVDSLLHQPKSSKFYDLAAIGQIGDGSDISQNEVRNMVFKGLNNIQNDFVKVVLLDMFGTLEDIAPKNLSFSVIPLINSVVRVGTMEEKESLFNAINYINCEDTITVVKRKKNKATGKFDKFDVDQTYFEFVYDLCKKIKGRQKTKTDKVLGLINESIDNTGGIAIGILDTTEYAPITGLIATKISSKFQKPTLLLQKSKKIFDHNGKEKTEVTYFGSGRGNEKVLKSLKDWCNNTGLVEFAQGHANAFGISIKEENFDEFREKTKNVESEEFVYEVDVLLSEFPDKELIMNVVDNTYVFGGKVSEPLIAFTNVKVNKRFINQRGSMLKFFDRGVEFVMYGAPSGLYESLTNNFDEFIEMDFVGRASSNSWGGKTTAQLILDDCERSSSPIQEPKIEGIEITAETLVF